MKLLEYEAKRLLSKSAITVPKSYIVGDQPAFLPVVIKSQVPVGGRGKAGGIVVAKTEAEYTEAVHAVSNLPIKGFTPKTLLAEELLSIQKELYLSLLIDKSSVTIKLMAHREGGIEVESNTDFFTLTLDGTNAEDAGQRLADYFVLPDKTFLLQDLIENLYRCFVSNDALLIEINPLVLTTDGTLVAGDCKIELDDAARFRHPDWHYEAPSVEANFVTLDPDGNVATIANGAGLAMATVDAVADSGLHPANFLDIGGGANEASVLAAFKRLVEYPNLDVIIINIFAGITRCDEVAKAILAAQKQLPKLPPLAVRLAGTNYEQAAAILAKEDIVIYPNLDEALASAKEFTQ